MKGYFMSEIKKEISKSSMIRDAQENGKNTPAEIAIFIKEKFGVNVASRYISVVKTNDKLGRNGRTLRGRNDKSSKETCMFNYVISSNTTDNAIQKLEAISQDKFLVDFLIATGSVQSAINMIKEIKSET